MKYLKGQSGNPTGRPKSSKPTAQKLRELIKQDDVKAILAAMVEQAKAGDIQAAKLILDRVIPPLKAAEPENGNGGNKQEPITFTVIHSPTVRVPDK